MLSIFSSGFNTFTQFYWIRRYIKYEEEFLFSLFRRELYWQDVKVSILEPGFFNTNIVSILNLTRGVDQRMQNADEEVKEFYGSHFRKSCKRYMHIYHIYFLSSFKYLSFFFFCLFFKFKIFFFFFFICLLNFFFFQLTNIKFIVASKQHR